MAKSKVAKTNSILFHEIEGETVILRKAGVWSQGSIYRRKNELFVKQGGGFVRMMNNGYTSVPNLMWVEMTFEDYVVGEMDHLVLS